MEGRQRRICSVERSYECSRLESQLLADAYRRVLPPRQFRLVEGGAGEVSENSRRRRDVSESVDRLLVNVHRTESSLATEGAMA
jgi:hypothetical protein